MSVDHYRRNARAVSVTARDALRRRITGFRSPAAVFLVVLSACVSESERPERALPQAAVPDAPPSPAVRTPRPEVGSELRTRVSQVPAFARLPASDQRWVLEQAAERVADPNARELVPLVQQLAEVRAFAVSEREEPLPAPPPQENGEVR